MCSVANSLLDSPANTEIAIHNTFDDLPDEVMLHIFRFLPPQDLARTFTVCKRWNRIAGDDDLWNRFDPKKVFPSLRIIDRTVWERYFNLNAAELSFEGLASFDNRTMIPALRIHFRDVDQAKLTVDKNAGWTVVEQPKGLNLNKLQQLTDSVGEPHVGEPHMTLFGTTMLVPPALKTASVDKAYRYIMSNNIFNNSANFSFNRQKKLVEELGYEMPTLLEATSLLVFKHMGSSVESVRRSFYPDDPVKFTRCCDKIDSDQAGCQESVVSNVGNFNGKNVSFGVSTSPEHCIGVAAVRKF